MMTYPKIDASDANEEHGYVQHLSKVIGVSRQLLHHLHNAHLHYVYYWLYRSEVW